MEFKEQTVIVTGGGYGIGREIALAFGKRGANLVLAARSTGKIETVAEELRAMGTNPLPVTTDIGSEESVKALVAAAVSKYGGVDILVNNAAIEGPTAAIPDVDGDDWREAIAINLSGTFYCCKYAGQVMREAGRGNIITLSSVGGLTAYPLRSPYAVSRWGVIGLSKTLAAELGPAGIRVNAVVPGPIEGGRSARVFKTRAEAEGLDPEDVKQAFTKDIPIGRMPTEEEVANCILFLASDMSAGVHGQMIQVDGGFRI
jgi:NAD(P)-dependent dehydrogenase (short-subunit alcohol dehydrogenase family)